MAARLAVAAQLPAAAGVSTAAAYVCQRSGSSRRWRQAGAASPCSCFRGALMTAVTGGSPAQYEHTPRCQSARSRQTRAKCSVASECTTSAASAGCTLPGADLSSGGPLLPTCKAANVPTETLLTAQQAWTAAACGKLQHLPFSSLKPVALRKRRRKTSRFRRSRSGGQRRTDGTHGRGACGPRRIL